MRLARSFIGIVLAALAVGASAQDSSRPIT